MIVRGLIYSAAVLAGLVASTALLWATFWLLSAFQIGPLGFFIISCAVVSLTVGFALAAEERAIDR